MEGFTYTLEKYNGLKSRHTCPECNYKNQLARYVDASGAYIADHVGRCNRESRCGYHFKPREYFEQNPNVILKPNKPINREPVKPVQFIPDDILKATLKAYERNTFVTYLNTIFNTETVQRIIDAYGIGTAKDGSCIFWQVDPAGNIRTGKVIKYQPDGHRDKSHPPYFIHTKLKVDPIEQCLFGLHLMTNDPIGLVESEKTACIMSGRLPEYTWMATGGKSNLSKVHALKGKKVVAFPDTDAFDEWTERLAPYAFKISAALQKHIPDPESAYDLADFIHTAKNHFETLNNGEQIEMHHAGYPASWT